jgi:hypothetical protein
MIPAKMVKKDKWQLFKKKNIKGGAFKTVSELKH